MSSQVASSQGETRQDLADDPVGDERRDVGRRDRRRKNLDDVGADELDPRGGLAHRPEEVDGRHPAGLRCPGPRRERRIEDVDVHRDVRRAVADVRQRPFDDLANAKVAHVVHEEAVDSVRLLPRELIRPRPVAAQADLDVPRAVDATRFDEPEHRGSMRVLHAEHLAPGVRVRIEMDESNRAPPVGDRRDARLGDRMVPAEDDG